MAQTKRANSLKNAYAYCNKVARAHYENFPVASFFLPKKMRDSIAAIYAFARLADDYADDVNLSPADKIHALNHLQIQLMNIQNKKIVNESSKLPQVPLVDYQIINSHLLKALADTIYRNDLPIQLLQDLLTAFSQDVTKTRYANFNEVLNYCSYSANPIGRILLHLSKQNTAVNLEYSDCICTSLQLINFLQDLTLDLTNLDRCYIPADELEQYQVSIEDLMAKKSTDNINNLIQFQLDRICSIYQKGIGLGNQVNGLFGFEIRLIIAGGKQILQALNARQTYYERPKLAWANKLNMFMLALFPHMYSTTEPMPIMVDK